MCVLRISDNDIFLETRIDLKGLAKTDGDLNNLLQIAVYKNSGISLSFFGFSSPCLGLPQIPSSLFLEEICLVLFLIKYTSRFIPSCWHQCLWRGKPEPLRCWAFLCLLAGFPILWGEVYFNASSVVFLHLTYESKAREKSLNQLKFHSNFCMFLILKTRQDSI